MELQGAFETEMPEDRVKKMGEEEFHFYSNNAKSAGVKY